MDTRIPVAAYSSDAAFRAEQDKLFRHHWQFAGFARNLAEPEQFITFSAAGRNVVVQNFDGELRAFTNVCSHRFSRIHAAPAGRGPLRCPYHGWQYDATGLPRVIPHRPRFDNMTLERRQGLCLEQWRVETCGELVFVCLNPSAPSLQDWLGPRFERCATMSAAFGELLYASVQRVPVNWKVLVENSLEGYHVNFVHGATFAPLEFVETGMETDCPHTTWSGIWKAAHQARVQKLNEWLYATRPFRQPGYQHTIVWPNLLLACSFGTSFAVHPVTPVSATETDFGSYFFSTKLTESLPPAKQHTKAEVEKGLVEFNNKVFAEDLGIVQLVQQGLRDARGPGILSDEELRVARFHDDYLAAMGA